MKNILSFLTTLTLTICIMVSPIYAGGGQVQGDNSEQGDVQGDRGNGDSPGDDAQGRQS